MQLSKLVAGTLLHILIVAGSNIDENGGGSGGGTVSEPTSAIENEKKSPPSPKADEKIDSPEDHELEQFAVHQCMRFCRDTSFNLESESHFSGDLYLFLSEILMYSDKPQCSIDHSDEKKIQNLEPIVECRSIAEQSIVKMDESIVDCCKRCVDLQNHSSRLDIGFCGHAFSDLLQCMADPDNEQFVQLVAFDPSIFLDPESYDLPCYYERSLYIYGGCGKE